MLIEHDRIEASRQVCQQEAPVGGGGADGSHPSDWSVTPRKWTKLTVSYTISSDTDAQYYFLNTRTDSYIF